MCSRFKKKSAPTKISTLRNDNDSPITGYQVYYGLDLFCLATVPLSFTLHNLLLKTAFPLYLYQFFIFIRKTNPGIISSEISLINSCKLQRILTIKIADFPIISTAYYFSAKVRIFPFTPSPEIWRY